MKNKPFYIILFLGLVLMGCKSQQKIQGKKLANKKNLPTLLQSVENAEFKPDWLAVKASVDFEKNEEKTGFKANIRMKRDSMIWLSITPVIGVELARVVLTPDSVKMVNRLEGTYFLGDYNFLNKTFDVDLDYATIQAMLLGNSLSLEDNDKLVASIDDGVYLLSGLKKRKLRKSYEKEEAKGNDESIFSAWIDPISFKITRQSFVDFNTQQSFDVFYNDFKTVENEVFPHQTVITLEAEEKVTGEISYSGLVINLARKMPFSISSKYEPVKF